MIKWILLSLLSCNLVFSAAPVDTLLLWPKGAPGASGNTPADIPTLAVCLAAEDKANGTAFVVCPGGGYGHLAVDHEGKQIAAWLNENGIHAFVLKYRIAPQYHHPAPLLDAQRALRLVRSHAQQWHIQPDRIGIIGFSAGGHLAASTGTHFLPGRADAEDEIEKFSCRPDFMVLVYPVITMHPPVTHMGSRRNLIGENPDSALVTLMCNDEQVTKNTPPSFIIHTTTDAAVPVENALLFYQALRKADVPAELHIFRDGPHGFGLGRQYPFLKNWPELCLDWLTGLNLLKRTL
jgi:acetyl esterase/lipase